MADRHGPSLSDELILSYCPLQPGTTYWLRGGSRFFVYRYASGVVDLWEEVSPSTVQEAIAATAARHDLQQFAMLGRLRALGFVVPGVPHEKELP